MPGVDRPRRTGNLTRDEKLGKLGPEGIRKQKAYNQEWRLARKLLNKQLTEMRNKFFITVTANSS